MSQHLIATNYGNELGPRQRPLYPSDNNNDDNQTTSGHHPYIDSTSTLPLPQNYILTKTHCGGYCTFCRPSQFIISAADEMEHYCASEKLQKPRPHAKNVTRQFGTRAIHLFRHPLDNIVSRMHHDSKHSLSRVGTTSQSDRDRLEYWCQENAKLAPKAALLELLPQRISSAIVDHPLCGVDFFRYIQWHNRVWEMSTSARRRQQQTFPVLHLFYEDYFLNYNATVKGILDFLELPRAEGVQPIKLEQNKTYLHLYTPIEIQATAEFLHAMAIPPVWQALQRYFPDYQPPAVGAS
jgi:hypothetical protein